MIIFSSGKNTFTIISFAAFLFTAASARPIDYSNNSASFADNSTARFALLHDSLYIDSLKKIISKGYTWGHGGPKVIQSQKRYINANTALGDYYAAKYNTGEFNRFIQAEKYYGNVAKLTDGTDSDLADEASVIRLRDNTARKLLRLYLSVKPAQVYKEKLFSLVRRHNHLLKGETTAIRQRISKMLFGSASKIFFEQEEIVAEKGKGITCYFNPVYLHSVQSILAGKGKTNILDSIAILMKHNPELRLKVESGPMPTTMRDQQYSWEITNYAIRYIVDMQGVSPDRFLFFYGQDMPGEDGFMGYTNMPVIRLTFAMDNEEGPATVEPPMPRIKY